jgi:hypothetical protein
MPTVEQLQIALAVCQEQRNKAKDEVIDVTVRSVMAEKRMAELEAQLKVMTPKEPKAK